MVVIVSQSVFDPRRSEPARSIEAAADGETGISAFSSAEVLSLIVVWKQSLSLLL